TPPSPSGCLPVTRARHDALPMLLHRLRVRARGPHPILRLADLGGRDHLQRAGHLAGVLHALDLGFDFPAACHLARSARGTGDTWGLVRCCEPAPVHLILFLPITNDGSPMTGAPYQEPVALNSSMPFLNAASISSFHAPVLLILATSSPAVLAKWACSPSSNAPILLTGTSSR